MADGKTTYNLDQLYDLVRQQYNEHLAETVDPYIQAAEAEYEEIVQDVTPYIDVAASQYTLAKQTILSAVESETVQDVMRSVRRYAPAVIPLAQGNVLGAARNVIVAEVIEAAPEIIEGGKKVVAVAERAIPVAVGSAKRLCVNAVDDTLEVLEESAKDLYYRARTYVVGAFDDENEQPKETPIVEQLVSLVTVEDQSDLTDKSDQTDQSTEVQEQATPKAVLVSNTPGQTTTGTFEETQVVSSASTTEETAQVAISAEPGDADEQAVAFAEGSEESDEVAAVGEEENIDEGSEVVMARAVIEDSETETAKELSSPLATETLVQELDGLKLVSVPSSVASQAAQVGPIGLSDVAVASSVVASSQIRASTEVAENMRRLRILGEETRRKDAASVRLTTSVAQRAVEDLLGSGLILAAAMTRHFGDQGTPYVQRLVDAQTHRQRRPGELNDDRIVAGIAVFQQTRGGSVVDDGVVAKLETEAEGRNLFTVSGNGTASGSSASSEDPDSLIAQVFAARDEDLVVDEEIGDYSRQVSQRDILRHPVDVLV